MKKHQFSSMQAAEAVMAPITSAGKISSWSAQAVFGRIYVRFHKAGHWFDLRTADLTAWGL